MENYKLTEIYQLVDNRQDLSFEQKMRLAELGDLKHLACYWKFTEDVDETFFQKILARDSWRLLIDCFSVWGDHENLCRLLVEKGSKFLVVCYLSCPTGMGMSATMEKALIDRRDLDLLSFYECGCPFEDESAEYLAELAKTDPCLDKWRRGLDL